jgi:hypothetical protein
MASGNMASALHSTFCVYWLSNEPGLLLHEWALGPCLSILCLVESGLC